MILKTGTSVAGEVTAVEEDENITVNKEHPFKVTFHYKLDGADKGGESIVWKNPGEDITVGQAVSVKYVGDKLPVLDGYKLVDVSWLALVPLLIAVPFVIVGVVLIVVLIVTGKKPTSVNPYV